jgi:hypothetical protein
MSIIGKASDTAKVRRDMLSPKQKKTISAVIVVALALAMVLTMVLPYIARG